MTKPDTGQALLRRQLLTQTFIWAAATGAILFLSAGTIFWAEAWIYVAMWLACGLTLGFSLAANHPDILRERMRSPMKQEQQKGWDKPIVFATFFFWLALHVFAGLDVRFGWSFMPAWLEITGAVLLLAGFYLIDQVMRTNTYASAVVKVDRERGHKVISTGPYAIVRHPMYTAAIPYFVGVSLLLGSWAALVMGLAVIGVLAFRSVREEEMLMAELDGYRDYANRVRYRLIPGLW